MRSFVAQVDTFAVHIGWEASMGSEERARWEPVLHKLALLPNAGDTNHQIRQCLVVELVKVYLILRHCPPIKFA
jgi:hypothetical protein